MKLKYWLAVCLFPALTALADDVINADSLTAELMTVGYNKALDKAKIYYTENKLEYNRDMTDKTLQLLSAELNTYLDRSKYKAFMRDKNITYFNLFLNRRLISTAELIFENTFTDEPEGMKELKCLFTFGWNSDIPDNPDGMLTSQCHVKQKNTDVVLRTGIGKDSIFVYQDSLTKEDYTSDTKDGIPDFVRGIRDVEAYNLLLQSAYKLSVANPFTVTEITNETTYKLEIWDDFIFREKKTLMLSSYYFSNYVYMTIVIDNPDGTQETEEFQATAGEGFVFNRLPVYVPPLSMEDEQDKISPFTDMPVRGRFLTGLARNEYPAERLADFLNSAWRSLSSRTGYTGIPYRSDYSVIPDMLTAYLETQGKTFTQLHLYDVIRGGRIRLYRWSDKFNGYVSGSQFQEGEKNPLDVGNYPTLSRDELQPPDMTESLLPVLNSFFFLREIELKTHSQQCPAITVPFLGETVSDDSYCSVIEDQKPYIKLFFVLAWTLSGLIIVFRSN